jgi:hypothetical protein
LLCDIRACPRERAAPVAEAHITISRLNHDEV